MSEKERSLIETLGKLPDSLQNEFLAMAKGAVMMKDSMTPATAPPDDTGGNTTEEGG